MVALSAKEAILFYDEVCYQLMSPSLGLLRQMLNEIHL